MLDTSTIRELKEKESTERGVNVDGVDFVHEGTGLDNDRQWWKTGLFDILPFDIYMCRR